MKKLMTFIIMGGSFTSAGTFADILNDSHIDMTARTMYYNNDSRAAAGKQPAGKQLGQGFIFNGRSGYTNGSVGLGVDAIGLLGIKINGSDGHNTPTGMFPQHKDKSSPGSFGSLRLALKAKISKTKARAGFQSLNLPVIKTNDGRLLPSLYRGYTITSSELENLTLDAGFIDRTQGRNQTHFQKLKASGKARGYSSGFSYLGGIYAPEKGLELSYYFARLNDFYDQHYIGITRTFPLGPGNKIKADLRYFNSRSDGQRYSGDIDNDALGGMLWWSVKGNTFGLGYQKLTGPSNFPYLDPGQSVDGVSTNTSGGSTGLISESPLSKFRTAHEQAIVLRYSASLDQFGFTGLHFNSSYVSGRQARAAKDSEGQNEWVRTFGLSYDVPDNIAKGVTVGWKNVTYRTNITGTHSQDQNILLVNWKFAAL
ncbi:OprD family outer membrane porin [Klebsiella pneumoniae subsp. pneumoniae]|uniref:OprD family porin n=1 Tax=Klebsiella pneumoniae TaxID=573 RepID=UPI0021B1E3EC|nr:OprD family porin [Klebsiella pneumoniae]MCT6793360.1 OprD family outer membrane porin [Klebsiella pneumoniae subsp. pneumoniae]